MNITIIGAGAIGLLLGAKLSSSGHTIMMVTRREDQARKLQQEGIRYKNGDLEKTYEVDASTSLSADPDIVIVAVKSYNVKDVISFITHTYGTRKSPELLFIPNGMEHVRYLDSLDQPVSVGTVEHGAKKCDDVTVVHTGEGSLKVSSHSGRSSAIGELNHSLTIEYKENWYRLLAEKLIINCGINPLTALFQISNGELLTNPRFFGLLRELIKESGNVLDLEFEESWNRVQQVCKLTAMNTSSMLADVRAARRTEIDAISGFVLKEASLKGMDVPFTRFVFDAIKGLELKMEERL